MCFDCYGGYNVEVVVYILEIFQDFFCSFDDGVVSSDKFSIYNVFEIYVQIFCEWFIFVYCYLFYVVDKFSVVKWYC